MPRFLRAAFVALVLFLIVVPPPAWAADSAPPQDMWAIFREAWLWLLPATFWAYLARMAYHVDRHIRGTKKLNVLVVLMEMPIAVFMGVFGAGIAEQIGLTGKLYAGAIAGIGWLGPRAVEWIIYFFAKKHLGENLPPPPKG